jgi:hypothetical protein
MAFDDGDDEQAKAGAATASVNTPNCNNIHIDNAHTMKLRVKPSLANGAGSRGGAIALLIPKVGPRSPARFACLPTSCS